MTRDYNDDSIISLYKNGYSLRKIANLLGCDPSVPKRILIKNNIEIRSNKFNSRKYHYNYNFFQTIDSESKAYWLGFIYADGYISKNKFGIKLSIKDLRHLEQLKKDIETNHPIETGITSRGYGTGNKFCRIVFTDYNGFLSSLIDKGVIPNKSNKLVFPTKVIVPENLLHHFIRGYFDGDGSVYITKQNTIGMSIVSTFEFLEHLIKIPEFTAKIHKEKRRYSNTYYTSIGGTYRCFNIYKYLYRDATVFLERKKEIFEKYYKEKEML